MQDKTRSNLPTVNVAYACYWCQQKHHETAKMLLSLAITTGQVQPVVVAGRSPKAISLSRQLA